MFVEVKLTLVMDVVVASIEELYENVDVAVSVMLTSEVSDVGLISLVDMLAVLVS